MTITLKIKFGEDTRRLTLEQAPTYQDLLDLIRKIYNALPTNFSIKYIDEDEDHITIGSDLELSEAIRLSGGNGPHSLLKLFITGAPVSQTINNNSSSPNSLDDLLKAFCPPTATNDIPDLVNMFQHMGLSTSIPVTNDPEQLRQHLKTLFQQFLNSPLIITLLPHLSTILPQMTAFLSSFENVKKENETKEQEKEPGVVHEGVVCDACNQGIQGIRYKCSQCWNYDLCESCERKGVHDKNHILMKIQFPIHHPQHSFGRGCPYNRNRNNNHFRQKQKHLSRYIADITVPDGSSFASSTQFVKIWRMRNEGQAPWPIGTSLEHVGGDSLASTTQVLLPVTVEAGAEVDIAVDMTTPESPGRYVSFWKLADSEGNRFGQRVWVDIYVEPKPVVETSPIPTMEVEEEEKPLERSVENSFEESAENSEELSESIMDSNVTTTTTTSTILEESLSESSYVDDNVKKLVDMGFGDTEVNRKLLIYYHNDMVKTVQHLLN